jgi:hypothetical protein
LYEFLDKKEGERKMAKPPIYIQILLKIVGYFSPNKSMNFYLIWLNGPKRYWKYRNNKIELL